MAPVERAISRRLALSGALLTAATATSAAIIGSAARATPFGNIQPPPILARQTWAQGLPPTGTLPAETVKCLVIHHTASANSYTRDAVPAMLRSFYHHHTTTKGWPDVAYNFFVDAYGTIYEGRAGSLAGPVAGSATGGNQGCTQLCCFVGNLSDTAPTPAASQAMAELTAWLAHRYDVNLQAKSVSFPSRGSNKHPVGSTITVPPIAGHRDLSLTACPGDAGYAAITGSILPTARAILMNATRPPTVTSSSSTTTRPPDAQPHASTTSTIATSTATEESPAPADPTTDKTLAPAGPTATPSDSQSASSQGVVETSVEESNSPVSYVAAGAAAAVTAAAGGAAYLYRQRAARKPTH